MATKKTAAPSAPTLKLTKIAKSLKGMAEAKIVGVNKSVPTFNIDPRIIKVREGFNGRPIDLAHVAEIKLAKKAGAYFPPYIVAVVDGEVYMIDGHHRLWADMERIADGDPIKAVACVEFTGTDAERVMLMCGSQGGLKMTPLQLGLQYKKMVNQFKWAIKAIADFQGKSSQHVSDMIALANTDTAIQEMVTAGEVAGAVALKTVKAHGSKAAAVLAEGIADAKAAGKAKVTPKGLKKAAKAVPAAKLGDSYVQEVAIRAKATKTHLAGMIKSPGVNPNVRVAAQLIIDTIGGRKVDATAPTKMETGLFWLQELAANKNGSAKVRDAARWFEDALRTGAFVKGTAAPAPSIMSLEEAVQAEIDSDGSLMAEVLCPEHRKLIVYLRSGKAA